MKTKWGALMVDGRGKIGGQVASKNRAGAYMRTKVTPVNPQTSYQTAVRALFASLSQAWRALTETQRDAWNAAVVNFQKTDIFGDLRTPTGINLFVRLNTNIINAGGTQIDLPPVITDTPQPVDFSAIADVSGQTLAITFTPTPVPASTAYIVEATQQVSPGKNFLKNLYRVINTLPAAATSPSANGGAYTTKFGAIVLGQKIGIRIKAVDLLTGLTSQPVAIAVISVA